jgi:spore protease
VNTRRHRWFEHRKGMNVNSDFSNRSSRASTDLAVEAHELSNGSSSIQGMYMDAEKIGPIAISRITIESIAAAKRVGKAVGHYTTLEVPELRKRDPDLQEQVAQTFAKELSKFLQLNDKSTVLVVGLGNWNVTPDSLGPLVVEKLLVTRHLFSLMPEMVQSGFRSVCAFAPGVLGLTGMETSEIVSGVVDRLKPDLVIAIDALAARSLERVNATVQVADTGIQPGGGVGNHRLAINQETLGVKVIAIGVPTVVDAATIASDTIDLLLRELDAKSPEHTANSTLHHMPVDEKKRLIAKVLQPLDNNLLVTPKEVDEFVEDMAYVLALALNAALHPDISFEEARELTRG